MFSYLTVYFGGNVFLSTWDIEKKEPDYLCVISLKEKQYFDVGRGSCEEKKL